ncbi:MAG: T9SS type A sorting domain-containing protein [Tenuifilaceae bacterium]|nr:T9SS type A sorting domain-containing protein [Bacteroidales bacterium]MDI9515799.1 T9SS type A sorting domain-containing protein [Bacteroidota bacterium]NLH55978.1 T9SS type A sorting domain-containing protein [Rikenellaceae bacterium]HNV81079.1 T9SS type A sorting domain-containing protein [Tenuifilaceae bacterium]MZP83196.1 T9SS type A sorting domain-containing protein [Bacteroidales bacterium]
MKHRTILLLFMLIVVAYIGINHAAAQYMPRGAHPGELYISCIWYYDLQASKQYDVILFTQDYGKSFTPLHVYEWNSGGVPVGIVDADASPDVLYNFTVNGLYRSFDNAQTWEMLDEDIGPNIQIATGNIDNEVFKKNQNGIYKSTDNGDSWLHVHENIPGGLEVGNQPGELYVFYGNVTGNSITELTINHSFNDGVEFVSIKVDTSIVGYLVSGYGPTLTRGATEGEVYLVSWWYPANYKIFRGTDHGQSFTQQYEQPDTCYFWDEYYYFTAGRGECEFYIIKAKHLVDDYTRLHVFHSTDCAQTFTEYVHELTPDYDGNPDQIIYTIAANASPLEGGTVEGGGKYHEGYAVTLNALPNEGYKFTGWTEGDNVVSEELTLSFTAESTRTLVAQFQLINNITSPGSYGITLYPNPITGNTITFELGEAPVEQITIYNAKGVAVDWIRINEPANTYTHRHTLPAGFYVFTAVDRNGRWYNGKFVVQ